MDGWIEEGKDGMKEWRKEGKKEGRMVRNFKSPLV